MPYLGEAPLLDGGAMDQWKMEERGSVGGLRDKGSQCIHLGSITVCKGEVV